MPLAPGGGAPSTVRIDEASATVTYFGWSQPGTLTSAARWRIARLDKTSNPTTFLWADGNDRFDNVWDNRAGLTYT